MNQEYLKQMNITLFEKVIYKYLDPTLSQFVVVALVRANIVYENKFLWELLMFKKLWSICTRTKLEKTASNQWQKEAWAITKPTKVQLDEQIDVMVNAKIDSTVPNEVWTILAKTLSRN